MLRIQLSKMNNKNIITINGQESKILVCNSVEHSRIKYLICNKLKYKEADKMKFEELCNEDIKLIKDSMLENSVSIIAECQESKSVLSEESFDKEMNRGKRLVYLVNVLNDKKEYDYNKCTKVKVIIVKTDGGEVRKIFEEFPSHFTDSDINERLWDKYSDKYDDIEEILWEEYAESTW